LKEPLSVFVEDIYFRAIFEKISSVNMPEDLALKVICKKQ
jgi:hypothetical protein